MKYTFFCGTQNGSLRAAGLLSSILVGVARRGAVWGTWPALALSLRTSESVRIHIGYKSQIDSGNDDDGGGDLPRHKCEPRSRSVARALGLPCRDSGKYPRGGLPTCYSQADPWKLARKN